MPKNRIFSKRKRKNAKKSELFGGALRKWHP